MPGAYAMGSVKVEKKEQDYYNDYDPDPLIATIVAGAAAQ
jgi:hypothetical protein